MRNFFEDWLETLDDDPELKFGKDRVEEAEKLWDSIDAAHQETAGTRLLRCKTFSQGVRFLTDYKETLDFDGLGSSDKENKRELTRAEVLAENWRNRLGNRTPQSPSQNVTQRVTVRSDERPGASMPGMGIPSRQTAGVGTVPSRPQQGGNASRPWSVTSSGDPQRQKNTAYQPPVRPAAVRGQNFPTDEGYDDEPVPVNARQAFSPNASNVRRQPHWQYKKRPLIVRGKIDARVAIPWALAIVLAMVVISAIVVSMIRMDVVNTSAAPVAEVVVTNPDGTTAAQPSQEGEQKQPVQIQVASAEFIQRPLNWQDWVENNSRYWIWTLWLLVPLLVLTSFLAGDRASNRQYTDVGMVIAGQVLQFIIIEFASPSSIVLNTLTSDGLWFLIGTTAALMLQAGAALTGRLDFSPLAVGFFSLGAWMIARFPDSGMAVLGVIAMVVGVVFEAIEIMNSKHRWQALFLALTMSGLTVLFTVIATNITISPAIGAKNETLLKLTVVFSNLYMKNRSWLGGVIGIVLSVVPGLMAASLLLPPESDTATSVQDQEVESERNKRSFIFDSLIVWIMLLYALTSAVWGISQAALGM